MQQLACGVITFQSLHTTVVLVSQSLQTQPLCKNCHSQVSSGYVHVSVHRSSIDRELNFSRPKFYQVSDTKKKQGKSFRVYPSISIRRIMGYKVHIDRDTMGLDEILDVIV